MKAFTGNVNKAELLKEVLKHQELDNYVQGTYFKNGKGCAVGCAIESINSIKGTIARNNDHEFLSDQTQVPLWLIRVQDRIFEGLSVEGSKLWPYKFTSAINEGSDLDNILNTFLIKVIESTFETYDNEKHKDVKAAQDLVIKGLRENDKDIIMEGRKAAHVADVAYAADASAYAAAHAADAAHAAHVAYSADVADVAYAADASAYAAAHAAHAAAYAADARESHWLKLSNELIKLMKGCK